MEVPRASRGLCEGACLQTRGPAPSRLHSSTPMVCPSSRLGAFAFSHQLERRGATRAPASRAGSTAAPMAPSTFCVALVIELQLWAIGHTVPAQVGDSQGHGGKAARNAVSIVATPQFRDSSCCPIPSQHARHAPLGSNRGPEAWHIGAWGGVRGPGSLRFQKCTVLLSTSAARAWVTLS